jgi:hypothetical protein
VKDVKVITAGITDLMSRQGLDALPLLEKRTLGPLFNHLPSLAAMKNVGAWNEIYFKVDRL